MSWVGRSIRRFEDRALLLGRGRFTADGANGAAAVRFARSPVPRGRLEYVAARSTGQIGVVEHDAGRAGGKSRVELSRQRLQRTTPLVAVEARWAAHLLTAWEAGHSSLRAPLQETAPVA